MPHDFFAWIASHVLTDAESMQRFRIFWGLIWFAVVKGWHAAEYAILFLFTRAVLDRFAGMRPRAKHGVRAAYSASSSPMSDEYHQTFVPGRGGTLDRRRASTAWEPRRRALICYLRRKRLA